ncbi:MAG: hypothetical protein ABGZ35_19905 [Planctomycetaceae bacterium]
MFNRLQFLEESILASTAALACSTGISAAEKTATPRKGPNERLAIAEHIVRTQLTRLRQATLSSH